MYGGACTSGVFGDLWIYQGSTWKWISGTQYFGQPPQYTGTPYPGARYGSVSWSDGNMHWIFGGASILSGGGTDMFHM